MHYPPKIGDRVYILTSYDTSEYPNGSGTVTSSKMDPHFVSVDMDCGISRTPHIKYLKPLKDLRD